MPDRDAILQEHWDEHTAWSILADRSKRSRKRARIAVTILTVFGAALQTIAGTSTSLAVNRPAGVAGTVALALVPGITAFWLRPDRTRKWLRARSISEGIKSEFYLLQAGAAPYDQADSLSLFNRRVTEILSWGKDMHDLRAGVSPTRKPFPAVDRQTYIEERVEKQIRNYYEPKAKRHAIVAQRFRYVEIVLALMTAAISALATVSTRAIGASTGLFMLAPWVAVLTTIGGTVAAFVAGGRYDFQATTYFATAANLKDLVRTWTLSSKPIGSPEWSEFVNKCESTISAENRGWMAKLDDEQTSNSDLR